jgi:cytochrome c
MDSFEWNKIFGAILGTALFVVALNIGIGMLMKPHKSEKPGMDVAVTEPTGPTGQTPVADVAPDWGTVIPAADVAAGEKVHQRCLQCHDFAKGGPNKIGPNLYGIMGAKHARIAGFAYSPAMTALADKDWGYNEMYEFMKNPKGAIPGTKMAFAGLSKQGDRVNLIAYLRTLSDAPIAIPAAKPAEPAPAAPAEGGEPAGELQAPPPGTAPADGTATPPAPGTTPAAPATAPAVPGATAPSAAPAAAPGTPATPAAPATPAPAKPAGGGH